MDQPTKIAVLVLASLALAVVLVLGVRGESFRDPPRNFWPDMVDQAKFRPQSPNAWFADGRAQRMPVEGTLPWGGDRRAADPAYAVVLEPLYALEKLPVPIDRRLLEAGRGIFDVYCAVCHGRAGDGKGITTRYGMLEPPSYHSERVRGLKAGEIFKTITEGKGQMGPYADKVAVEDRWAVVAWVRALQRAQAASIDDVPADARRELER